MLYMLVYIYFQAEAGDYKEMSAGIVALAFAMVNFCRTVVRLWQLHVFKPWMVASIRSIRSLGYEAVANDVGVTRGKEEMNRGCLDMPRR